MDSAPSRSILASVDAGSSMVKQTAVTVKSEGPAANHTTAFRSMVTYISLVF